MGNHPKMSQDTDHMELNDCIEMRTCDLTISAPEDLLKVKI